MSKSRLTKHPEYCFVAISDKEFCTTTTTPPPRSGYLQWSFLPFPPSTPTKGHQASKILHCSLLNKAFCSPLRHSLFFIRFCFVTYKCQALVILYPLKISENPNFQGFFMDFSNMHNIFLATATCSFYIFLYFSLEPSRTVNLISNLLSLMCHCDACPENSKTNPKCLNEIDWLLEEIFETKEK